MKASTSPQEAIGDAAGAAGAPAGVCRRWSPPLGAFVVLLMARPSLSAPVAGTLRAVEQAIEEGDVMTARSQLEQAAVEHPDDCAVRAWLAWLEIESGRWSSADALLGASGCPAVLEDRGRWAVLRALAWERRDEAGSVRDSLLALDERQPLWPEDRALVRTLSGRRLEGYTPPFEARADLALGATSNAFAASPVDSSRLEAPGSAVVRPDLHLRLRAPAAALTPSLEIGARGYGISTAGARGLSHAELSAAAGLRLGRGRSLPTVRYRHDEFLLDAAEGRYAASDRAELSLSPSRHLTLFGGGGRRVFLNDGWRTRVEWDLAGFHLTSLSRRPLVLGGALRYYSARRSVHDQVGGTLSAAGELRLRARLRARLTLSASYDAFPRSGGNDGLVAFGTTARRHDTAVRLSAELWRPLTAGAALALRYELARRFSTADEPGLRYYPYSDHRLLVSFRVGHSGNPWRTRSAEDPGRVRIPYRDLAEPSAFWDDEMRRLLRQEEDLASDCGCTVP